MLSLVLLAAILFLGVMAQGGRASCDMWNRCTWLIFWCGAAVTVGMWAVNPWAALTFGMLVLGALTVAPWEQAFPRALYPAYAAGLALAWLASPWWLLGLPLLVLPLLVRVNKEGVFAQAHVHLGSACVAFLVVCLSRFHWPPWPILAGYVLAGVLVTRPWSPHRRSWDGRRFQLWNLVLREVWWPMGWRRRLLGVGTATWEPLTAPATMAKIDGVVFTTAHNEYVQFLVEHGLIGLGLLLSYLVLALGYR